MIYKSAVAPVLIEEITERSMDNYEIQISTLIKKLTIICTKIKEDHDFNVPVLESAYKIYLPATDLLDFILTIDHLISVNEFSDIFGTIPQYYHYDEQVWTIPYDFIPDNVYDWGEYDINYTFGDRENKSVDWNYIIPIIKINFSSKS